jgi:hypothetical protein
MPPTATCVSFRIDAPFLLFSNAPGKPVHYQYLTISISYNFGPGVLLYIDMTREKSRIVTIPRCAPIHTLWPELAHELAHVCIP